MASQTPTAGARSAARPASAPKRPALPPMSGVKKRRGWMKWAILLPMLLLGTAYLLGRIVEPIRARLVPLPVVGSSLFKSPVWPILWNKSTTKVASDKPAEAPAATAQPASGELSALQTEAAARLADAEVKENELRRREADLAVREAALKAREASIVGQETLLGSEVKATGTLKAQLEGQLRSEQDRVEIIRAMKTSGVQQMFTAMTDAEIIRILMYMDAAEVAKLLAGLDAIRSTRILFALQQVAPQSNP